MMMPRLSAFVRSPDQRLAIVRITMALVMVAHLVTEPRVWWARPVPSGPPTLPLFAWLPRLPQAGELLLWSAMLGALAFLIVGKAPRRAAAILAFGYAASCVFDHMRFQPHFTIGPVFLLVIAFTPGPPQHALRGLRLSLASLYFFAGLGKLNVHYAEFVHPSMMKKLIELLPTFESVLSVPWLAPVVEMLIGLVVFRPGTWKTRRLVLVGALGLHAFILTMLLLAVHDLTVIPFNLSLAISAFAVLCDPDERDDKPSLRSMRYTVGGKIALGYAIVVPVLSQIGVADAYLGHAYYSGAEGRMRWYLSAEARDRVVQFEWPKGATPEKICPPAHVPAGARPVPEGMCEVKMQVWYNVKLGQALPGEARNAEAVKTWLCEVAAHSPTDVLVRYYGPAHLVTGDRLYQDADCDGTLGFWIRLGGLAPIVVGGDGETHRLEGNGKPVF